VREATAAFDVEEINGAPRRRHAMREIAKKNADR
jgi:hypothetical protein